MDELGVGFLAGAFAKFLTIPIANIVTRKQTSSMLSVRASGNKGTDRSVRSIALQIRAEKGLRGFWSGYSASLVLTLNPSLTFFFFEALKRTLLSRDRRSDPTAQNTFLIAAISKGLASSITYPFSLAKSRLQADTMEQYKSPGKSPGRQRASNNVFLTIIQTAQHEGIGALYEGLSGEILKGFFSHGITMIVKEAVHKLVIQLYYALLSLLKKYPSPQELTAPAQEQANHIMDSMAHKTRQAAMIAKFGVQLATQKGQALFEEISKSSTGGT